MTQIDWSKAPEGATHYLPRGVAVNNACWYIIRGNDMAVMRAGVDNDDWTWRRIDEYDREHFIPVAIPRPVTWNGDVLPPVGTVCEMKRESIQLWEEVEILCHGNRRVFFRDKDGNEESRLYRQVEFRHLRTAEQIAAEEREKAIEQMMEDYKYKEGPCTHHLLRSQAERIYDAGYRKVEGGDA